MITNIVLHEIGNKTIGEGVLFSHQEPILVEETKELLEHFFLSTSSNQEITYQFYHETGSLELNPLHKIIKGIFENQHDFITSSISIGRHLYDTTVNPTIIGGDLFVVKFQTEEMESVGIFKIERKDTFLKLKSGDDVSVKTDRGVSITKIDRAAIIYNYEKDNGYLVKVVDNNKRGDVFYWFEDFLKVRERQDEFFNTRETMQIFKDFIKKELPQQYEVSQADQADFLNKSLRYFKENEVFNFDEFAGEVLGDDGMIDSFGQFQSDYEQETQTSIPEEFSINPTAVKKTQRFFKSIVRLDKNFHIYIHGDRKKIEQGEDKKGKFYKLYYENED